MATDHGRGQPGDAALPCRALAPPDDRVDLHRFSLALHGDLAPILKIEQRRDMSIGVLRDQDGVRVGRTLHAGCQVDGVTDGQVLHVQVAADVADHHDPGVQADPHLKIVDQVTPAQLGGVCVDAIQDFERGTKRPFGVILVGQRRAEESQNTVSQQLSDRALVAINRLAHARMRTRNHLAPVFGVHRLGQRCRAHDIGEQRGHQFALAFEPVALRQDLLRQRLGRGPPEHVEL